MNQLIRAYLKKTTLLAMASAALSLPAFAQPAPAPTPAPDSRVPGTTGGPSVGMSASPSAPAFAPNPGPPGGPNPMMAQTPTFPKYFEGVITPDEFQAFQKFQMQMKEDPATKDLMSKIQGLRSEMRELQNQLVSRRAQVLVENPEMKAISEKMQGAMRAQMSGPRARGPGAPTMTLPPRPMPGPQVPPSTLPAAPTPPDAPSVSVTPKP